jgi:regulatory protein
VTWSRPRRTEGEEPRRPQAQPGLAGLSLKGRALKYLAAREHSRAELARKLAAHAESPEQIDALLDELERLGYLSAERVVASVIHRKAARFGSARIRQELVAKGLDITEHGDALGALRDTEFQRAHEAWQRRFGETPASDAQERARQARFLLARGFPAGIVARIVRGSGDPASGD